MFHTPSTSAVFEALESFQKELEEAIIVPEDKCLWMFHICDLVDLYIQEHRISIGKQMGGGLFGLEDPEKSIQWNTWRQKEKLRCSQCYGFT